MFSKKIISLVLSLTILGGVAATAKEAVQAPKSPTTQTVAVKENTEVKIPKYVFLFIGDGNALSQVSVAETYLGALKGKKEPEKFAYTQFHNQGFSTTHSLDSYITDSAAAGTAIATGYKTNSGMIGVTPDGKEVESIADLADKKGKKIGVVTSTTINHATPASFYSSNVSRNNYHEIGHDLIESDFEYFAGGMISKYEDDKDNLYDLAKKDGYKIVNTRKDFEKLSAKDGKVIVTSEDLQGGAIPYEIDKTDKSLTLAEMTTKGIEVLDNDKEGFFMVIEGGKVDWASHANDAAASIQDSIAFSEAIDEAIKFYNEHPEETLILVTSDHETGGMTMGFAGTGYGLNLDILKHQKVSFEEFDKIIDNYLKDNKSPKFSEMMQLVEENFGLKMAGKKGDKTVLTDYEIHRLMEAYRERLEMDTEVVYDDELGVLYGSYDPFSVTVTHILNQKAGIGWTSYSHTGIPVPVYAQGAGSEAFNGYYDNTDIFKKLKKIMGV